MSFDIDAGAKPVSNIIGQPIEEAKRQYAELFKAAEICPQCGHTREAHDIGQCVEDTRPGSESVCQCEYYNHEAHAR